MLKSLIAKNNIYFVAMTQTKSRIRSYVTQRAHITPGQARAIETLKPIWGIPYQDQPLDLAAVFGRQAPTSIEIGSGMGEATAEIALQRPAENFIAIEVFDAGVGALLRRIEEQNCHNLRVIQHDAVEVLQHMIAPQSLTEIRVFFPDPWPKKRHHKRRIIQPAFVSVLSSRLASGGQIHCATDWEDYAWQMLEVLSAEPSLRNQYTDFAPRGERPMTKFERRGLRLGHGIWDLVFKKR
ncbi:MAG TPA: tRNA (guanosine(46)-N7)-methyltransferase TrmB [Paenalcaligenes sp.]|nr:tRNA (guanosine(46)-N7)-methyltransferase TrmB [Paenalcaligenes sp.]